jgi:hypothetical protein
MTIDLDMIKNRLFANAKVRDRILRDYAVPRPVTTAEDFARSVVAQFDQAPSPNPLEQRLTNDEVFRAAVKAIASNSRAWATFLTSEPKLRGKLNNYCATPTHRAFAAGHLKLTEVSACLPGQSSGADSRAIEKWAGLLNDRQDWYSGVREAGSELRRIALERLGKPLPDSHLVLCLVALLAGPPPTRRVPRKLVELRDDLLVGRLKLPGMGYVLASEFLRNLHWNAFKPDRHVQRLFNKWFPDAIVTVQREVDALQDVLGWRSKDLAKYLTYSLIGIEATPAGIPHSFTDNLVWLLGAYLEKKNKESDTQYALPA